MYFRKYLIAITLILFLFSCRKTVSPVRYKGEVTSQVTDCVCSTGNPMIITCTNQNNIIDSFITTTLPGQFKAIHKKIEFEVRDLGSHDERILCISLITIPHQKMIYNVMEQ